MAEVSDRDHSHFDLHTMREFELKEYSFHGYIQVEYHGIPFRVSKKKSKEDYIMKLSM